MASRASATSGASQDRAPRTRGPHKAAVPHMGPSAEDPSPRQSGSAVRRIARMNVAVESRILRREDLSRHELRSFVLGCILPGMIRITEDATCR